MSFSCHHVQNTATLSIVIIPSFMVYDHNFRGHLFCNLPAKTNNVIWWDLLVSYSYFNFSYLFFIYYPTFQHDLRSQINQWGTLRNIRLRCNFDEITMKLGIISICPVALSCYTSSSLTKMMASTWPPASIKCLIICPADRYNYAIRMH
jgi:hypothetical protein